MHYLELVVLNHCYFLCSLKSTDQLKQAYSMWIAHPISEICESNAPDISSCHQELKFTLLIDTQWFIVWDAMLQVGQFLCLPVVLLSFRTALTNVSRLF